MPKPKTETAKKPGPAGRLMRTYESLPSQIMEGAADAVDSILGTNPRRKVKRKSNKPPSAAQLRCRRNFARMAKARATAAKKNRTARPATKTNRSTRARVNVTRRRNKNPGVIRFTESQARQYSGKIKGLSSSGASSGSRAAQKRPSKARATTRARGKTPGILRRAGRAWLQGMRTHHGVAGSKMRRNAATRTGIFEPFHGKPSERVRKFSASDHVPLDVDVLGALKEFTVKQEGRPIKVVRFNPKSDALVASRGKGGRFKLHVLGAKFAHRSNPGELLDIGHIQKLCYITRKNHLDDGQIVHYTHTLKSPYPILCVDHEGRPVIHDPLGGRKIDERGIID